MISIRSSADLAGVLDGLMEPAVRALLAARRDRLLAGDIARIVVVRPYNGLAAVEAATGLPLARGAARYRRVTRHPLGIIEAEAFTDAGYAVVILARDCVTTDAALLVPMLADLHRRAARSRANALSNPSSPVPRL